MASQVITVISGAVASPVFALDPAHRALAIQVPSYNTATLLRVEYATAVDASTLSFGPMGKPDASGPIAAVFSVTPAAPIWGVVELPPTPFARLVFTPAVTATLSVTILPR